MHRARSASRALCLCCIYITVPRIGCGLEWAAGVRFIGFWHDSLQVTVDASSERYKLDSASTSRW
jgi:hypothetical protein